MSLNFFMPWSGNKPFEFQCFYLKMLKSLRTFCSKTIISFNLDKKYHNIQLNFKASNAENKAWWSLYNTVQSGIVLLILSSQRFKNSVGRKCAKIEKDVFRLVNSEIFLFVPRSPQSFFFVPRSWHDKKHLSLFLCRAQNLPSVLFSLQITVLKCRKSVRELLNFYSRQ